MILAGLRALKEMYALTRDLRNLKVLAASGVLSALGAGLLSPVLPGYLESHGLAIDSIGLVFTLGSVLPMALQPLLGALSDRMRRRGFLIGISMTTSLLVPALALLPSPLWLSAALAAKLMLDRSAAPLSSAMIGDFAPKTQRATVFGLLSSAVNMMFVVALLGSSAAIGLLGSRGAFFMAGALFFVSSAALFALREADRSDTATAPEPGSSLLSALRALASPFLYIKSDPSLFALFAYQFCFTFALDLFPIYLPLFATKLGAPEALLGPIIASSWLVYALIQPIGGRLSDKIPNRKSLIYVGLAGMAACAAILGASSSIASPYGLVLMIGAWVVMAIPDGLFRPSADALLVDLAPPKERGRFLGALGASTSLANVVAPLAYGLAAARFGLTSAFILSAAALIAALISIARVKEPASSDNAVAAAPSESL